jgi:hypothetical protein
MLLRVTPRFCLCHAPAFLFAFSLLRQEQSNKSNGELSTAAEVGYYLRPCPGTFAECYAQCSSCPWICQGRADRQLTPSAWQFAAYSIVCVVVPLSAWSCMPLASHQAYNIPLHVCRVRIMKTLLSNTSQRRWIWTV